MTVWYTHSKRQHHKTFSETHTSGTAFHTHVYNVQKSLYHQVDISSTLYTQWQKGLQLIKSASPKQFQALRMDPSLNQTTKCFYCSSPTALLSLVAIEVSQGVPKSGTLLDGISTCSVSNFHFRSIKVIRLFCCFTASPCQPTSYPRETLLWKVHVSTTVLTPPHPVYYIQVSVECFEWMIQTEITCLIHLHIFWVLFHDFVHLKIPYCPTLAYIRINTSKPRKRKGKPLFVDLPAGRSQVFLIWVSSRA